MYISYDEENAKLKIIDVIKKKKYVYENVPYCVYRKIKVLQGKNCYGSIWQILKERG